MTLAFAMATAWIAFPVGRSLFGVERLAYPASLVGPLAFVAIGIAAVALGRRALLSTAANRIIVGGLGLALAVQPLIHVANALAGVDPQQSDVLSKLVGTLVVGLLAVAVEPRIWPSALGYLAAYLLASARSDWLDAMTVLSNLGLMLNAWWIWGRRRDEEKDRAGLHIP